MRINKVGRIEKGWGYEQVLFSDYAYCIKELHFISGKRFSMHFHKNKHETWIVQEGKFELVLIDTKTGLYYTSILSKGSIHTNQQLEPHQLICIEEGYILEVSTADYTEDNYRVLPGDSQNGG